MPKLPDFQVLGDVRGYDSGRPMPSLRVPVADNGAKAAGDALISAGDKIAAGVMQEREKQNQLDFARADADFLTKQTEYETKLRENPDYSTWADNYRTEAPKLLEQSGAIITDPRSRELWAARQQVHIARGVARFSEASRKRNDDAWAAGELETLQGPLSRTFIDGQDEETRTRAVDGANAIINGLVARGVITAVRGQELRRSWVEGNARGYLSTLPPEEQVAALGGNQGALRMRESGGNPGIVNQLGYAGLYQFGAPRLADMGVYQPGPGESLDTWSKTPKDAPGKWTGTFNIPGFPEVKTLADFLKNPAAQEAAYKVHDAKMDTEIKANGLDRFIGQNIGGITVTPEGIKNMMHLAGAGGAKRALESGGADNPRDANGTGALDYLRLGSTTPRARQMVEFLPPDDRAVLRDRAEAHLRTEQRRIHAAQADERAALSELVKDDLTSIATSGTSLPEEKINRERVTALLGEQKAQEWLDGRARAQRVFEVVDGAATLPASEITGRLAAIAPVPGTKGYDDDLKAYTQASTAVNRILDARGKDVAAAADAFPFVKAARAQAAQDAQADPTAAIRGTQAVISGRLMAQDTMRIPGSQQKPLTVGETRALVEAISGPDAQKTNVRERLDAFAQQYGEHWPRVFGQLVTDGKLPPAYQVLATMTEPKQRVAADQLQRGLALVAEKGGWQALRSGQEAGTAKQIEDAITSDLSDFRRATAHSSGGERLYEAVHNAAKVLAYEHTRGGMSPGEAATAATQGILREKYEITGTALYPKDKGPQVLAATRAVTAGLSVDMLAPSPETVGTTGMTPEARQTAWLNAVRRGDWVANKDTSGLVLMAQLENGARIPVRMADGSPVEVRFDALPGVNAPTPVAASVDNSRRTGFRDPSDPLSVLGGGSMAPPRMQ